MKPPAPDDDELIDYLECLSSTARRGLCALLGLSPHASRAEQAARAREASDGPQVLSELLRDAGPDEIALLACWSLRGATSLRRAEMGMPPFIPDPVPGPRGEAAVRALESKGLGVRRGYGLDVLPCARPFLAAHAYAVQLTSLLSAEGRAPLPFGLALALGLFAVERPLVRADGDFHSASIKRLERRLGGTNLAGLDLHAAPSLLARLGLTRIEQQGHTRVLEVEAERFEAIFGTPSPELARRLLWDLDRAHVTLWTLARLRFASAASQGKGGEASADLNAICEARIGGPGHMRPWQPDHAPDPWDTIQCLSNLAMAGLVEQVPKALPARFRPRDPAPHGAAPWVVQPNFEVLVPWDAPPLRVARLGLCADLEKVDRVCRFRLSAESVRRATECLWSAQDLLRLLEEGAHAPLAQNVRATLLGWAGGPRPVRPLRGDLLLAAPDQVAALCRLAPDAREVAPGLLLLAANTLEKTLAGARALGLPVAAVARSAESEDNYVPLHDGSQALTRVEDYLAHAVTEAPEPRRPSAYPGGTQRRRTPSGWNNEIDVSDILRIGYDEDDEDEDDEFDDEGPSINDPFRGKAPSPDPWFRVPERDRRGRAPPHADVTRAPDRKAADPEVTWTSPLPGPLRTQLQDAIRAARPVRLMFRNASGATVDRRITPLRLTRTPKGDVLEARDEQHQGLCTIVLERVVALAQPPPGA